MAFTPFVETDQPSMENFNEKFQEAIQAAIDGALDAGPKMQIVSYVGTGTYGASNPCSITADFPIESAEFLGILYISGSQSNVWQAAYRNANQNYANNVVLSEILSQSGYKNFLGFSAQNGTYGKKSSDGKTISWYSQSSYGDQLNDQTGKYYFLCRG